MAQVFISHRSADSHTAELLASELANAGHAIWLDEWEIGLGDSIIGKMNEGLEGMSYLVLCCSASGNTAPWMGREWMSSLARQLDGKQIKILPVLLSGAQPPAILSDIKYADLAADWKKATAQLLTAIK